MGNRGAFKKGNQAGKATQYKRGNQSNKGRWLGSKHWNWQGGVFQYPDHGTLKQHRRIVLIHNPDCEICNEPAQEIHHKDRTKSNHKLSNLIGLCYSCHRRVHSGKLQLL